mgnify:CR=1 FL=1
MSMGFKRHLWRKEKNGGKKMKGKQKKRKVCLNVKCNNDAPKDSAFCGLHKPKTTIKTHSKVGCHTGNVLVFTTPEGIEVYGGGSSRQGGWWVMNPLPDLAIGPSEIVKKGNSSHSFPKGWLIDSVVTPDVPIVSIDFPDYGIPTGLGKVFWLSLVEDIYTHNVKRISCQCMGGHGRTGVQLCILAHYLLPDSEHEWKDAGELIDWIRDRMCVHEVEARKQQDYIAKVCDIPVGEYKVGERSWGGYGGYGGNVVSGNSNWDFDGTQWSKIQDDLDSMIDIDDFDDKIEDGDIGDDHALKQLTGCDVFDRPPHGPINEDDCVYECIECDQREIWMLGSAPLDEMGGMSCLQCKGDMIDITDLPETQADLQYWISAQDIDQVDIKVQGEEE